MQLCLFFFFKQKTAYEMRISDWSSDVCSSDLAAHRVAGEPLRAARKTAFPAAERRRREQAAREQRRVAEHRHAIGEGIGPGARRHLVDEAFGEEGGVAVGIAAPARGRQAAVGGAMIDRMMRDRIERRGAKIGREWCRGRVSQYEEIPVAAGYLKKKKKIKTR